MAEPVPITVAYGDGIGPEIMDATLHVLREAGARITVESVETGERIYNMESDEGILPSSWNSLRRTHVLLKAPSATPGQPGYQPVSDAIRNKLGNDITLFEPPHDTQPELEGADKANPSEMILASVRMLVHIGQPDIAMLVHNALLRTQEDGIRSEEVGTQAFAAEIVARLWKKTGPSSPVTYEAPPAVETPPRELPPLPASVKESSS